MDSLSCLTEKDNHKDNHLAWSARIDGF